MSKLVNRKTRANLGMVLGVSLLLTATSPRADDGQCDEFRRCSSIEDSAARLACYDKLGGYQKTAPMTVSEEVAVLPDELGAESLSRKDDEKEEPTALAARVTKCTKSASNEKYVFYLDGGQIWKQISDKKLFYKECAFNVTISRDFFGYKMQVDGEKSRFRVSRVLIGG